MMEMNGDGSDEPPWRRHNMTYDAGTNFCKGHHTYNGQTLCVLPAILEPQFQRLCTGTECSPNQFKCHDGSECIDARDFCDGYRDCRDGSDEIYRNFHMLPPSATVCRRPGIGYICVLPSYLLPYKDKICQGSSCDSNELLCMDGMRCFAGRHLCDGYKYCQDGSDEPPLRNNSITYDINTTFCRSERGRICVLPAIYLPYEKQVCYGLACLSYEFSCDSGSRCVRKKNFCDGERHCNDETDEPWKRPERIDTNGTLCRKKTTDHEYRIRICELPANLVLYESELCDGSSCKANEFSCANGRICIPRERYCDGYKDCDDETDEPWKKPERIDTNGTLCREDTSDHEYRFRICELPANLILYASELCDGSSCKANEFSCANGRICIPRYQYCNGNKDCEDGSDEFNQPEKTNFTGRICHRKGQKCMIFDSDICDGVSQCDQAIDECLCPGDGKYLTDKRCFQCLTEPFFVLPISKLCDGAFDCHDLTDECLCSSAARPKLCKNVIWDTSLTGNLDLPSIRCASSANGTGVLVKARSVCDSRLDCQGGDDEAYCTRKEQIDSLFQIPKILDHECGNPVGKYAAACDGIPECNDFIDEECQCDTTPEFCGSINVVHQTRSLDAVPHEMSYVHLCKHVETGDRFEVSLSIMCDGTVSCEDQADERGCNARFNCTDEPTPSIPIEKKCDKQADCENAADEEKCSHFSCKDNGTLQYISRKNVCDGIQDCEAGSDECQPGCIKSAFSDEQSLIRNKGILTLVWIISVAAITGGLAVMAMVGYRIVNQDTNAPTGAKIINRFILSLAVSDFLVGMYTMAICIKALQVDKNYCVLDRPWRSSVTCSALGAMLVIGSEQSVLAMVLIASYRLKVVARPFSHPSNRQSIITILLSWLISILLGVLPLFPQLQDYFVSSITFNENTLFKIMYNNETEYMIQLLSRMENNEIGIQHGTTWNRVEMLVSRINPNITVLYRFGYYSSHTVCLPTFFPDRRVDLAWGYSLLLLIINFTAFLFTLIAYIILYRTATSSGKNVAKMTNLKEKARMEQNIRLQRKLTRIVVTDFLCWMPICIMGFLQLAGVDIPKDAYLPSGLLIIPINSALNPLLYSDLPEIIWERVQTCGRFLRPKAQDEVVVMEMQG